MGGRRNSRGVKAGSVAFGRRLVWEEKGSYGPGAVCIFLIPAGVL